MAQPSDEDKLRSVLRLAFQNDRAKFDRFCQITRDAVPEAHAAVLRGSSVTGKRHSDNAPFDADGPGTSDLDLTLVGSDVLRYFSAFWIPAFHSKPLSDADPDIAPALVPLRAQLMDIVRRPVNIQGTCDWVQFFRGDIMEQPYLLLYGDVKEP
ncbi:MAG TPA: hypothetical protein VL243_04575 [Vicinamibacterales bacterium]|nr:hypothetical protein [Vicinamibacterales bacterium]